MTHGILPTRIDGATKQLVDCRWNREKRTWNIFNSFIVSLSYYISRTTHCMYKSSHNISNACIVSLSICRHRLVHSRFDSIALYNVLHYYVFISWILLVVLFMRPATSYNEWDLVCLTLNQCTTLLDCQSVVLDGEPIFVDICGEQVIRMPTLANSSVSRFMLADNTNVNALASCRSHQPILRPPGGKGRT